MPLKSVCAIRHVAVLLFLVMQAIPGFAVMYKWVDEHGVTHYGDTIPPQYQNRANEELNKGGVVIKKNDPALTPEQIKARDDELAKHKQQTEDKRRDAILLGTYTSVEEIDLARDRNLKQIEQVLNDTQAQLKTVEDQLAASRKNAAAYARQNEPVPDALRQDIEILEKNKQDLEVAIVQKRVDTEELRKRFEADRKRYIELTQPAPTGSTK
ncbi:MAG TPA: DUF4124 domain-containing protein [Burkholderiales bacterium]|nr:DUF4124 domain-containing protein [Burkholderiales bacterium]